jgi:hypothetical protein
MKNVKVTKNAKVTKTVKVTKNAKVTKKIKSNKKCKINLSHGLLSEGNVVAPGVDFMKQFRPDFTDKN